MCGEQKVFVFCCFPCNSRREFKWIFAFPVRVSTAAACSGGRVRLKLLQWEPFQRALLLSSQHWVVQIRLLSAMGEISHDRDCNMPSLPHIRIFYTLAANKLTIVQTRTRPVTGRSLHKISHCFQILGLCFWDILRATYLSWWMGGWERGVCKGGKFFFPLLG